MYIYPLNKNYTDTNKKNPTVNVLVGKIKSNILLESSFCFSFQDPDDSRCAFYIILNKMKIIHIQYTTCTSLHIKPRKFPIEKPDQEALLGSMHNRLNGKNIYDRVQCSGQCRTRTNTPPRWMTGTISKQYQI